MLDKLGQIETRYEELTNELSSPELFANPAAYGKAAKQLRGLGEIVEKYRQLKSINEELAGARELQEHAGDEASLFAADILRMYSRYAERQRWRLEVLDASESGIGGLKEATVLIEGDKVYSKLKHESGVHRVQRVPQTEASGRIHTSAITVAVLPEAEEVDVKIDPKDLRIDTFCSSGPGGQSVNTTYSAVRITH